MIYDRLDRFNLYPSIPYFIQIREYLQKTNLSQLPVGDHEIIGRDLYIRVLHYTPETPETRRFETHRLYADIHIVGQGVESIYTALGEEHLLPLTEYDSSKEIQFFKAKESFSEIVLREGEFAVFLVGESHRPQCQYQLNTGLVKKYVFKVKQV